MEFSQKTRPVVAAPAIHSRKSGRAKNPILGSGAVAGVAPLSGMDALHSVQVKGSFSRTPHANFFSTDTFTYNAYRRKQMNGPEKLALRIKLPTAAGKLENFQLSVPRDFDATGKKTKQQDCVLVDTRLPLIDVGSGTDALLVAESVVATVEVAPRPIVAHVCAACR